VSIVPQCSSNHQRWTLVFALNATTQKADLPKLRVKGAISKAMIGPNVDAGGEKAEIKPGDKVKVLCGYSSCSVQVMAIVDGWAMVRLESKGRMKATPFVVEQRRLERP
jgi:hypothetical protein